LTRVVTDIVPHGQHIVAIFPKKGENAALYGQNMKKFSTAAAILAFASVFLSSTGHAATADESRADPSAFHCTFRQDAPDQHVVVTGDT